MATLTKEQIEQKKQQLKQLAEEVKQLTKELVEAGAIELSEEDLEKVSGGWSGPGTGFSRVMEAFYKGMGKEFCPYNNPDVLWTGDWKGEVK